MIKVYCLSLNESNVLEQWDSGFVLDMFADLGYEIWSVKQLPKCEQAIVLLPARHHAGLEAQVQIELDKINNCVFFALGDEEASFKIEQIQANHIWVQNPRPGRHENYHRLGTGYPPQLKTRLKEQEPKFNEVFFSGQITHDRRREMWKHLEQYSLSSDGAEIYRTQGFTQGMPHQEYYQKMARAKVVPCPSGAVVPDSFRLFEALECMAIPIADEVNPSGTIHGYWDWLFNQTTPFPKIVHWHEVNDKIQESLQNYDSLVQKQTCWWLKYKRDFKLTIKEQLNG